MQLFYYRAADHAGKIIEGTMEAEAEGGVIARLHEMGCVPLRIAAPGQVSTRRVSLSLSNPFREKVGARQLLHFTQELATLLSAGLPLDRSLSVLSTLVEGNEFRRVVGSLLEAVRAGKALSAAISEYPGIFPRLYVNMVGAGETGGVLDKVLKHLCEYLERSVEFKEEVKAALVYPISLAVVSGLSLVVLFIYVIPKFSVIFADAGDALPWITVWVMASSGILTQYGWIALVVLAGCVSGLMLYIKKPAGRLRWDSFRLRLWLVGTLIQEIEVARFARTLSVLLAGGVPLLQALGTVRGIVGNVVIANAIERVQSRVKEGKGMMSTLSETGVVPPLALHMIGVGEETGRLEEMLAEIAKHYDEEVRRSTKRLTSVLEPLLILTMGGVVGTVVVSMLMAIFSINQLPL
jgi:type II secretion system protein F